MAGDWIKLRTNLWTDPRVAALCNKTGASCAQIVGACAIIWSIADTHSDDGCLWGYSPTQLDSIVATPGFCDAMSQLQYRGKPSPWMELGDGFVRLVDYKRHNGKTAKKRMQTALRASRFRNAPSVTNRAPRIREDIEKKKNKKHTQKERGPNLFSDPSIAAIYAAYPKQTGPDEAGPAIASALARIAEQGISDPVAWLLAKVQTFAASSAGKAGAFVPAPAKWFNRGSFNDDEAEWNRERHEASSSADERRAAERAKRHPESCSYV